MDEASTSESEDDGEESDELMDDDGAAPLVAHWPTTSPSASDNSDDNSDDPLFVAARRGPSAAQARFNLSDEDDEF